MSYQCLKTNRFTYKEYEIVPYREADLMQIMRWRNEQMDVLRQNRELTEEDQIRYYRGVIVPTFVTAQPIMVLFSYLKHGECIGYGGLTNMDWHSGRAEISFLVDTARTRDEERYREDFSGFLHLMKEVAFGQLAFNRLFTETFDIRPRHIGILEGSGFRLEGRMKQHVRIGQSHVDSLIHGYLKEYDDAEQ